MKCFELLCWLVVCLMVPETWQVTLALFFQADAVKMWEERGALLTVRQQSWTQMGLDVSVPDWPRWL